MRLGPVHTVYSRAASDQVFPGIGRLTIDLERLKDSDMCTKHTFPCMNVMANQYQIARLLPGLKPCFWSRCWISRGLSLALHYKEATDPLEQPEPELPATLVPLSASPLAVLSKPISKPQCHVYTVLSRLYEPPIYWMEAELFILIQSLGMYQKSHIGQFSSNETA